jgi:hypothetical protein
MKKKLNLAVALMLIIALLVPCAVADTTESALPQVGGEVNGFTVKSVSRFDLLGADLVLYENLNYDPENGVRIRRAAKPASVEEMDDHGVWHKVDFSYADGEVAVPGEWACYATRIFKIAK